MSRRLEGERLITLGEAARHPLLTRGRKGAPVSQMTLWRWTRSGVYGVKLETVAVDGKGMLRTSVEALGRFIDRVKANRTDGRSCIPAGRVPAKAAG
jgi:hypothetical protein